MRMCACKKKNFRHKRNKNTRVEREGTTNEEKRGFVIESEVFHKKEREKKTRRLNRESV
jgi:hypothetical protein